MKIKMITLAAGPEGVKHPGKIYDVSDTEAKAFVTGGYAEYVGAAPAETIAQPQETEGPSMEAFGELSAADQKSLLEKLAIEGDAGNEEKRTALYAAYLEAKKV